jgi:hypothetical protein
MIEVINECNIITTEEINQCLNRVLNKKYFDINITIKLYKNYESLLKDYKNNPHTFLSGEIELDSEYKEGFPKEEEFTKLGEYNCINDIKIYPFNIFEWNKKDLKNKIIHTILHEIRHAFQRKYYTIKFNKNIKNYIKANNDYNSYKNQWVEIDANKFADFIFNKKKDIIYKALNIAII